jgi:hypothetical protein
VKKMSYVNYGPGQYDPGLLYYPQFSSFLQGILFGITHQCECWGVHSGEFL